MGGPDASFNNPIVQLDAVRASVGTFDPAEVEQLPAPPDETSPEGPVYSNPRRPGQGCAVQWLPMPCAEVLGDFAWRINRGRSRMIRTEVHSVTIRNYVTSLTFNGPVGEYEGDPLYRGFTHDLFTSTTFHRLEERQSYTEGATWGGAGVQPVVQPVQSASATAIPDVDPCGMFKGTLKNPASLTYSPGIRTHIINNHINYNKIPEKSKYVTNHHFSEDTKFNVVQGINAFTFLNAKAIIRDGLYFYVWAIGERELPTAKMNIPFLSMIKSIQPVFGIDSNLNRLTNVNTLVLEKDCKTVRTSHPGLPDWLKPGDRGITGEVIYAPTSDPRLIRFPWFRYP